MNLQRAKGQVSKYSRLDISRRTRNRAVQKSFLLVVEGAVTEVCYFEELRHHLKLSDELFQLTVHSAESGDPKTLIKRAESCIQKRN